MLIGWLICPKKDLDEIKSLGIKITKIVGEAKDYRMSVNAEIELDKETATKLDKYWGRWLWGLSEKK